MSHSNKVIKVTYAALKHILKLKKQLLKINYTLKYCLSKEAVQRCHIL